MSGERPDDAREPDGTAAPGDGDDGLEARRASDTDAPFHGLRSAADIFGAPRSADEWPSRRERREAEKAARETGEALPEPFAPAPSSAPAAGEPVALDDGATQAISMPEELAAPTENPQAVIEHERETLSDRIPAAAPVPPTTTAQHPSSITLPTAQTHRDERAAENRAVDEERRRVDPFGQGRSDVDWLGRATGPQPAPAPAAPTGPIAQQVEAAAQQPLGVENVLPAADEPPSFTELLRIADGGEDASAGGAERPFDWAIRDDEAGEVPATLTADRFDTTTLGTGSWSLAAEDDDDVVSGEVPTPGYGLPAAGSTAAALGIAPTAGAAAGVAAAAPAEPSEETDPTGVREATDAPEPTAWSAQGDEADPTQRLHTEGTTTAWWAEPETTVPPTAAPLLVEPAPATDQYPAHLPPAVGQDLDAVAGLRGPDEQPTRAEDAPERLPAVAPDDLDQSEWDGRETSDTSAIKDLFGTEAVGQLGGTGYDPEDTGTKMMPAPTPRRAAPQSSSGTGPSAAALAGGSASQASRPQAAPTRSGAPDGDGRDNFINEGFARLRSEGRRGKLLLIWGSVALIVVLLVAVFALTRWILGNTIEEHTPAPTRTAAASVQPSSTPATSEEPAAAAPASTPAGEATVTFATTPAAAGVHAWYELAGGECLSPFSNAWAETYTVVDCAAAHLAQLTARLDVTAQQWPGAEALATQAASRCQATEALDTTAAAAYGDVQVQGSYAPDQGTWDQGNRFVWCFVTRSSGQALTGSLAPDA